MAAGDCDCVVLCVIILLNYVMFSSLCTITHQLEQLL